MHKGKGLSFNGKRENKKKIWKFVCMFVILVEVVGMLMLFALQVVGMTGELAADTIAVADRAGQVQEGKVKKENLAKEKGALTDELTFKEIQRKPGVPLIAVDPGHGGSDGGTSKEGVKEKDVNLEIAKRLEKKLLDMGYQVLMIREDDTDLKNERRAEMANYYQADIYVSIHQNDYEMSDAKGIETWFKGDDTERDSRRLAQLIHQQTMQSSGASEREIRDDANFCVTGQTQMPACLIETGFLSNPEERKLLVSETYQEKLADGIADGIELYLHPKTMYLTFDDGPSDENTNTILDILKKRNIKATFFLVGGNVRKHPEVAKRIVEEGHTIGVHCNEHNYNKVYQSVDSYLKDFEEAYNTILEVTGVKVKLFRFPGGSVNAYNKKVSQAIIKEMTARGFIYFDWNASLEDAVKKSEPEELIANAKATTLGRKMVVMLAHDIVYSTALCLEDLLDEFPEYQMEALTPEVKPIQFRQ